MKKSQTSETLMAMSALPEAAYNSMVVAAADMVSFKTRTPALPIPDTDKEDDSGEIGAGPNAEFASEQTSGFVVQPAWDISNRVDSGTFLTMLRRFAGGADTPTTLETGVAAQHVGSMLDNTTAAGRQLPSTTYALSNNGADYLWGGVVGNQLAIAQSEAAHPTFTMGVMGSGLYKRIRDISPAFGLLTPPSPQPKMLGPDSAMSFTDDAGNTIPTTNRQLFSINITLVNALESMRLAGASRIDPYDLNKGWYLDELLHNVRGGSIATMRLFLDDQMRAFQASQNNKIITSFKFTMLGNELSGTRVVVADPALDTITLVAHGYIAGTVVKFGGTAVPAGLTAGTAYFVITPTADTFQVSATLGGPLINFTTAGTAVTVRVVRRNLVEIIFNKCYFRGVRFTDERGNAMIDVTVFPVTDNVTFGNWSWRAINSSTAAIV